MFLGKQFNRSPTTKTPWLIKPNNLPTSHLSSTIRKDGHCCRCSWLQILVMFLSLDAKAMRSTHWFWLPCMWAWARVWYEGSGLLISVLRAGFHHCSVFSLSLSLLSLYLYLHIFIYKLIKKKGKSLRVRNIGGTHFWF